MIIKNIIATSIISVTTIAEAAHEYTPDAHTVFLWHLNSPVSMNAKNSVTPDASNNKLDGQRGRSNVDMGFPSVPGLGSAVGNFQGERLLRVGPDPRLMNIGKGFTIELWLRDPLSGNGWQTSNPHNQFAVIAQYRAEKIQWMLRINHADKSLQFSAIAEGRNFIYAEINSGPLSWEAGQWYHIAATCEIIAPDRIEVKLFRSPPGATNISPLARKSMKCSPEDLVIHQVLQNGEIRVGGSGSGSRFLGSGCHIDEIRYSSIPRSEEDFIEHVSE